MRPDTTSSHSRSGRPGLNNDEIKTSVRECSQHTTTHSHNKSMLPFRHVGPAKTEQWAGLIDAVYAIAMTVLALILPDILSECVRLLKHTLSAQYAWIGLYFIAFYFFAFLILYETWCFHRCLPTALPSNNRKQSIYTSLLLGIICLMPPLAAVTFKDIEMTQFWQKLPVSESIYSLGLLLWAISYLLIYLIAKESK
ncbi:MAG: DUF1211 domain-containing protein, partial [Cyanobacteria bacterium K_DeepCast_35m_m2_023]|nr:DUF1211 domain-containing protein [Cyanobacteria bacterium K_DeepCast_35m_m2_023]